MLAFELRLIYPSDTSPSHTKLYQMMAFHRYALALGFNERETIHLLITLYLQVFIWLYLNDLFFGYRMPISFLLCYFHDLFVHLGSLPFGKWKRSVGESNIILQTRANRFPILWRFGGHQHVPLQISQQYRIRNAFTWRGSQTSNRLSVALRYRKYPSLFLILKRALVW